MKLLSNTVHCMRWWALSISMTLPPITSSPPPPDFSWTQISQRNPRHHGWALRETQELWAVSNKVSKFSSHIHRNKAKIKGDQNRKMRSRIQSLKVREAVMPMKSRDLSFLSALHTPNKPPPKSNHWKSPSDSFIPASLSLVSVLYLLVLRSLHIKHGQHIGWQHRYSLFIPTVNGDITCTMTVRCQMRHPHYKKQKLSS